MGSAFRTGALGAILGSGHVAEEELWWELRRTMNVEESGGTYGFGFEVVSLSLVSCDAILGK